MDETTTGATTTTTTATLTRGERVVAAVDWVLRAVGVVSLVFILVLFDRMREQNDEDRARTECQDRINKAQVQRGLNLEDDLRRERTAVRQADEAEARLFLSPIVNVPDERRTAEQRAQLVRLLRGYQAALTAQAKARDAADVARIDNPPIEVPAHC